MNERIWELYGQALVGVNEAGTDVLDPVKFAELIVELVVRDCICVIQNELQGDDNISAEWVYDKIMKPVKQHFGVEE